MEGRKGGITCGDPGLGVGFNPINAPFAALTIFCLKRLCSSEALGQSPLNKNALLWRAGIYGIGGEGGIRTRDTLSSIHTF